MFWTMSALAAGACSPDIGKATLNEYNYQLNFSEVKRLNIATPLTGWKVRVYSGVGTYLQQNFPTTEQCDEYYVFSFSTSPKDADIVLLDANDDVVDILRARQSFPVSGYYSPYPTCSFISPPTDLLINPAQKGVDRSPDGVGPWRNTPGTGSNSFQTRCGGNTPGGATTDLRVTKTASSGSILLGANVTFTVTVTNLGPNIASTLIISDSLPAGLSYVSHTVTSGTYSAASGLWTLGTLAVNGSQTLSIIANGASAGTWTNIATVSADNPDSNTANNTASAAVTVASSAPGSFNAFETSTAANVTTGVIKTKIAGSAFNLDVVAISGGVQASTFSNTVKVELLGNTTTGIGLDGNNCPVSSTVLQTISSAISGGRSTVSFAAVSNAWKDVRVRISYPTVSPTVLSCSTDNFAIRPASLGSVSISDADSVTAGTARSLNNTAVSGGNVHKAGRPFRMDTTAINASGITTTNYSGSPGAMLTVCLLPGTPTTCTLGTLAPGSWAAASGVVTSTTASYSEAGAFTMKLVDTSFADVDVADSSTTERYIESAAINVGRFVPDYFSVITNNTPAFKTFNDATCPSRSFTYIGQSFGYTTAPQALITARNFAGATTQNYSGALWRPTPAFAYSSVSGTLDVSLVTVPTVTPNNNGTGSENVAITDLLAYVRNLTTPQSPFNASISLNMSVSDTSEAGVAGNGTISTTTPAIFNGTGSGIAFDSGNEFRYGRFRLGNAFGSELLDLPIPAEAQYWNGTVFVTNSADNCTMITATNVTMGNYLANLSACKTAISISGRLSSGKSNLKLFKPGAGNNGSVDVTVNLGAAATGQTCVAPLPAAQQAATAANQLYLQGKWTGTSYNQNPRVRATFGVYKNANELIYMRELY